ncbi:MAG: site-2 protease family protein [Candidatus Binatia bacterium]
MKWSFRIASVAGIPIRVHATFLLLLLFVAWSNAAEGGAGAAQGVLFTLLLFACVVAHELGHSVVGMRLGYKVRDITLLPIGGIASFERMPTDPRQELRIAIAGPLVNVALAAALWALLIATGGFTPVTSVGVASGGLLERLLMVNVMLAGFNLLPAFPMDGGRILRAFLAQRMGHAQATQTAARVGQAMALGFGLLGLLSNPFLLFIALFVYIGAEQEAAAATMRSLFEGLSVRSAMITRFSVLRDDEPVARALELLIESEQHDFPVVATDGAVVGMLSRTLLLNALGRGDEQRAVGDVVREKHDTQPPLVLAPDAHLEDAVEHVRDAGLASVPVVDQGRVVGLLTLENLAELAMIHNARARAARHGRPPGAP